MSKEREKIEVQYRGHTISYNIDTDMWQIASSTSYRNPTIDKSLNVLKHKIDRTFRKPLKPIAVWVHPEGERRSRSATTFLRGTLTQVGVDEKLYVQMDDGTRQQSYGYRMFTDSPANVKRMEKISALSKSIEEDRRRLERLQWSLVEVETKKLIAETLGKEYEPEK